jgi:hypothetical protein
MLASRDSFERKAGFRRGYLLANTAAKQHSAPHSLR